MTKMATMTNAKMSSLIKIDTESAYGTLDGNNEAGTCRSAEKYHDQPCEDKNGHKGGQDEHVDRVWHS